MEIKYDFDEIINRCRTNSISYEGWKQLLLGAGEEPDFPFNDADCIRLWIADMDFGSPPEILEAIRKRLDCKILGYTSIYDPAYFKVLSNWFEKRYNWAINPEHIVLSPGVVSALNRLVGLLTNTGESILICTPSYAPFKRAADYNHRNVFYSNLIEKDGSYEMNFHDIDRQLSDPDKNIKLFILCNPHNPVGRIWTREELLQIGEMCLSRGIWIISDEIHCDLLRRGNQHYPLVTLFPDSEKIITCTAPSKTFNLAGNLMSHIFIPNSTVRKKWLELYWELHSPLAIAATQAAYSECEDWLEQLKEYLDGNFELLDNKVKELLPKARFTIPEATYLAWINISEYLHKIPEKESLSLFFARKAGVLIEGGERFVANGDGYIRINVACPRAVLQEGITRLAGALNS